MPHFFSTAARALNTSGDVRVILAEGPALWFLFICFRNHPRRESERSQGQKLPGFGLASSKQNITVAILAQGTSRAVAVTQAFFSAVASCSTCLVAGST
jgi:hypothetical protein